VKTAFVASSAGLVTLGMMALLAGCDGVYPEPSEDAVYYFVANARLGGKMRVCWPAGQAYAVGITKAHAELQKELGKIRELLSYEADWPKDDPRWHDAQAVETHVEELAKLADEGADARREKLRALGEAVDKLPEGLTFDDEPAKEAFKQRLWEALAVDSDDITYLEEFLTMRLRLFEKVRECAGTLNTSAAGLHFTDASHQGEVGALYDAFTQRVAGKRERFFNYASEQMAEIRPLIAKIDKQKERDEYNLLDNRRSYFRNIIEGTQRGLRALIKTEQAKLTECEKTKPPKATEIAFHKHRIETLNAELAHVTERGQAITKP
jgi:hypothetical protein